MASNEEQIDMAEYIQRIADVSEETLDELVPISGYADVPLVPLEQAVEPLVSILPKVQCYAHTAKRKCKEPADDLTQDESAAIMLYTMDWQPRDECLYVALNKTLRLANREETLEPWYLYLRLVLNALSRLPSIHATVFRGVKLHLNKNYVQGEEIVWWGFSSCTIKIGVLQSNSFLGRRGPRTMFNVDCHSARDIRKHSYIPKEDEMLLLPATQFEVISCLDQNDLRIIQLKETRPRYPLLQAVPIIVPKIINSVSLNAATSLPPPVIPLPQKVAPITSLPVKHKAESVRTPISSPLKVLSKPSKPVHQNAELEKLIEAETKAELALRYKELTVQDIEIVAYYAIFVNKTFSTLDLNGNQIEKHGMQHLSNALLYNKTLTSLHLWDNKIGDQGTHYLCDALLHNKILTTLYLGGNQIGAQGARHLGDVLMHNKTLTTLNLGCNRIGAEGTQHLSDALLHNSTLTTLNLWDNQIGDRGTHHLSYAVLRNKTLTTLHLASNQIGDKGTQYLSDALMHNNVLNELNLCYNQIGSQGAQHLVKMKKVNTIINLEVDDDVAQTMSRCVIS